MPLDDAARAEVLRDRAQRRGLILEEAAIDWMLTHADRDLASLVALLDRLDRESLAAQRRITVPFLRQVMDKAALKPRKTAFGWFRVRSTVTGAGFRDFLPDHRFPVGIGADALRIEFVPQQPGADAMALPRAHVHDEGFVGPFECELLHLGYLLQLRGIQAFRIDEFANHEDMLAGIQRWRYSGRSGVLRPSIWVISARNTSWLRGTTPACELT